MIRFWIREQHANRYKKLPDVPLRMFGGMKQQTQNRGGKLRPANAPKIGQRLFVGSCQLLKCLIDLAVKPTNQLQNRIFGLERLALRSQPLALGG